MSTSTEATIRLDVASFVDEVRRHLADLSAEEREELTGGLEADLTERLEESRAAGDLHSVLGDPRRYAEELRAAAGLGSSTTSRRSRLSTTTERLRGWSSASGWPQNTIAWDFLVPLRPVWWVLRAWIAVQALDYWFGDWRHDWIPSFGGHLIGVVLLLVAIVVSVQIGRGEWWPETRSTGLPWYLLAAANVLAVVMLPVVLSDLPTSRDVRLASWWGAPVHPPTPQGVQLNGDPVRNIYAYDAEGRPLVGVQLYDQDGTPLAVASRTRWQARNYLVTYPWGLSEVSDGLMNVYPLPTREQPRRGLDTDAFTEADPPMVPAPPFVQVPAVAELPAEALEVFYAVTGTEPSAEPSEDEPDDTGPDKPRRDDTEEQDRSNRDRRTNQRDDPSDRDREQGSEGKRPDRTTSDRDGRGTGEPGD